MDIKQPSQPTKKERRELRQEEKKSQRTRVIRKRRFEKISIWSLSIILIIGLGYWIITITKKAENNKPGESFISQGQEHIANGAEHPPYNSNPPTSGWHYGTPARAGFYDQPTVDETLIHNLEHGYVIISYNCEIKVKELSLSVLPVALAHSGHSADDETKISPDAPLPENFDEKSCNQLQDQLQSIVQKYNSWKIIAVPRPANNARIALTAWTHLQKLKSFDENAIDLFIKAHRNKGPENTPE